MSQVNRLSLFFLSAMTLAACASESEGGAVDPLAEDERGSVGGGTPAAEYCEQLGYTFDLATSACVFPDGTSCEAWSFYRAQCGQEHSYCNTHGGNVTNETSDASGFAASRAICILGDQRCEEQSFLKSGACP